MIIITGASDGLGAAIVKEASVLGEDTMNISRRSSAEATKNITVDLSTSQGIEFAAKQVMQTQHPKAIILNAGVLSIHEFGDISEDEYERVMAINLRAPTLLLGLLFDWIRQHDVDVIVINSVAGQHGYKGQALYNVSKWGLRGLTESLREELAGTKCRVVGVYPGMLDTNISEKLPSGPLPKSKHATIPVKNLAQMIMQVINQPKSMEVTDIVIERKK
jgi:NAD(P)-dependent dehydrogenase (short-subunit alcohol dehydrogenase family)